MRNRKPRFTIEIAYKPRLFYLYCALLYNKNPYLKIPRDMRAVNQEVKRIMLETEVSKFSMNEMPSMYTHAILTTSNYKPTLETPPIMYKTIEYVNLISKISHLKEINSQLYTKTIKATQKWQEATNNIASILNEVFKLSSKCKNICFMKNFYEASHITELRDTFYIHLPWSTEKLEYSELLYDSLNGLMSSISISIPKNIEKIVYELTNNLSADYTSVQDYVRDCFIRALVIYISEISQRVPKQGLSEKSTKLILPKIFLEDLEKRRPKYITLKDFHKIPNQLKL